MSPTPIPPPIRQIGIAAKVGDMHARSVPVRLGSSAPFPQDQSNCRVGIPCVQTPIASYIPAGVNPEDRAPAEEDWLGSLRA